MSSVLLGNRCVISIIVISFLVMLSSRVVVVRFFWLVCSMLVVLILFELIWCRLFVLLIWVRIMLNGIDFSR